MSSSLPSPTANTTEPMLQAPSLEQRQSRLVIVDLNKTLVDRVHMMRQPDVLQQAEQCATHQCPTPCVLQGTVMFPRADFKQWVRRMREENISIGVWSCASAANVASMCKFLFGEHYAHVLACVFDERDCELDPLRPPSVTWPTRKNLDQFWRLPNMRRWNAQNTLVIDDSASKWRGFERHLVMVPAFEHSHLPEVRALAHYTQGLMQAVPTLLERFQQLRSRGILSSNTALSWLAEHSLSADEAKKDDNNALLVTAPPPPVQRSVTSLPHSASNFPVAPVERKTATLHGAAEETDASDTEHDPDYVAESSDSSSDLSSMSDDDDGSDSVLSYISSSTQSLADDEEEVDETESVSTDSGTPAASEMEPRNECTGGAIAPLLRSPPRLQRCTANMFEFQPARSSSRGLSLGSVAPIVPRDESDATHNELLPAPTVETAGTSEPTERRGRGRPRGSGLRGTLESGQQLRSGWSRKGRRHVVLEKAPATRHSQRLQNSNGVWVKKHSFFRRHTRPRRQLPWRASTHTHRSKSSWFDAVLMTLEKMQSAGVLSRV